MLDSLPDRPLPEGVVDGLDSGENVEIVETLLTSTSTEHSEELVEAFLVVIDGQAHVLTYFDGDAWGRAASFDADGTDEVERYDTAWELMPEPPTSRVYK